MKTLSVRAMGGNPSPNWERDAPLNQKLGLRVILLMAFYFLQTLLPVGEAILLLLCVLGLVGVLKQYTHNSSHQFRLLRSDYHLAIAIACVFILKLVSALWSPWPKLAVSNAVWHAHFLFWPLILAALVPQTLNLIIWAKTIASSLFALLILVLLTYFAFDPGQIYDFGSRNSGVMSQIVLVLGLWCFYLSLSAKRFSKQPKCLRLFLSLAFIASVFILYIANRRIEWFALLMLVFLICCIHYRQHLRFKTAALLATGFIFSLGLFIALRLDKLVLMFVEARNFFTNGVKDATVIMTSVGARLEMYSIGCKAFLAKPLLGWGAGIRPYNMTEFMHFPNIPRAQFFTSAFFTVNTFKYYSKLA